MEDIFMKLNNKIEINFIEFLKYGKFDFIKLGQTKEWILNNFPDPDGYSYPYPSGEFDIWTYGDIEFHFANDILYLIFSDYFDNNFNSGKDIIINKWIFDKPDDFKLINVLGILNENDIDYEKNVSKICGTIILRLKSGVELTFDNINEIENLNKNNYELTSFGLMNKELIKK
jgi:hypothetical protein